MIDNIKGNEEVKKLIKNELRRKKSSGTYLFYGRKGADLFEFALAFAKGLNCTQLEFDYCDSCRVCNSIDKRFYSDLHILGAEDGSIKIDQVRGLIKDATESSYEGRSKVFIIEAVNRLRKEAANALLKIIEEPPQNTYFILLSEGLNILATIKSRSMPIEVKSPSYAELGVSREVYDFFGANIGDIKEYISNEEDITKQVPYTKLVELLALYLEKSEFSYKVQLILAIEDYIRNKSYIDDIDKISMAEDIDIVVGKNREFLRELLYIFIVKGRRAKNLEDLLILKESIAYNVNTNLTLLNFFLEL